MPEITINIANRTYRLAVCPGEEELIQSCAETVDQQISVIRDTGKLISQEQVAVLAALELAYEQRKAAEQIKEKNDAVSVEDLQKTIEEQNAIIESLRKKNQSLKENLDAMESSDRNSRLLKEIDKISAMCENAIYSDMHTIGVYKR